jgi:homoserine dehydrogenase
MSSAFYVRMSVADRPGVLAGVASVFGEEQLSIRTVLQSGSGAEASLVMILHEGIEERMDRAMARIRVLDDVRGEPVVLRVLGSGEGG